MNEGVFKVEVDGRSYDVELNGSSLSLDGRPVEASVSHVTGSTYSLLLDGRSYEFTLVGDGASGKISGIAGNQHVEVLDRLALLVRESASGSKRSHSTQITAPMPGLVLKVEVAAGESVGRGSGLVVLEAMKMENEIFANGDGVVAEVHVEEGQPVVKGQLLLTLE